ncbi:MAG: hypothetical protein IPO91_08380 [Chloroflexi bacterium]|nr:hypothetical protein [Chloroflexota bacterium]
MLRRVEIATGDISILHQVDRSTEIGAIDLQFAAARALAPWCLARVTLIPPGNLPGPPPSSCRPAFSLRDEDAPERTGFYLTLPGKSGTFLTAPEDPDAWFVPSHQPIGLDWATNNVVLTAEDYGGTLIALRLGTE